VKRVENSYDFSEYQNSLKIIGDSLIQRFSHPIFYYNFFSFLYLKTEKGKKFSKALEVIKG
jgi:hypothetical protein